MTETRPLLRESPALHATPLSSIDPELASLIHAELGREQMTLDMIASENLVPRAVLEAQGSILTNKYADGYPGARDYDGCQFVDEVEQLAIDRAKALFGAEHANVQPYSGTSANAAVLHALCEPGDTILGWDFEHGGHPTHGAKETFAGRFYTAHAYHLRREDRLVDYDEVAQLARAHRPKVIFAGWSCYQRYLDFDRFRQIADEVGAFLVVDMAHYSGLVAGKVHPDPVGIADVATMTVHKTLGGARGGLILAKSDLAERIDRAVYPGEQGSPLPPVIAAKAVTLLIAGREEFRTRMERTVAGAREVARALLEICPATKMEVVTGGTDVHQLLVDVSGAGIDAETALAVLHAIDINANDMRIAYDAYAPPQGSGIRLGTGALATRGFDTEEWAELGRIVAGGFSLASRLGGTESRSRQSSAPGRPRREHDAEVVARLDPSAREELASLREAGHELLAGFPIYDFVDTSG
jgi:glycine hydroxymethyltransferase